MRSSRTSSTSSVDSPTFSELVSVLFCKIGNYALAMATGRVRRLRREADAALQGEAGVAPRSARRSRTRPLARCAPDATLQGAQLQGRGKNQTQLHSKRKKRPEDRVKQRRGDIGELKKQEWLATTRKAISCRSTRLTPTSTRTCSTGICPVFFHFLQFDF